MDPKHSLLGQNSQNGLTDCLDWIVTIISINSPTAGKTEFSDKLLGNEVILKSGDAMLTGVSDRT